MALKYVRPKLSDPQCSTVVHAGKCGDCGNNAFHPLEYICTSCAEYYGVVADPFTSYTYTNEYHNSYANTAHAGYKRNHYYYSNSH